MNESTSLLGRHVLLGVSGGIAAYKAAELTRLLVKAGADVQVVMTSGAAAFIAPMTFQALTGRPVRSALFDEAHEAAMGHIELARWADLLLLVPASANLLARISHGLADDLLTTLCLASAAPLMVAPAMNQQMWAHAATRGNIERLVARGAVLLGPDSGEQACGDVGPGRMLAPEEILQRVESRLSTGPLTGVRVLLTAGPTREAIDPVRYIGNRSSGRMGYALAGALAAAGAQVMLVSGPVSLPAPGGVQRVTVESALEMHAEVMRRVAEADLFVGCAAVADYRPRDRADRKIKKERDALDVALVRNPDILADVAALPDGPMTVGFAAETQDLEALAERKRRAKGVDLIAANLVGEQLGFERDDNALLVLWDGGRRELARQPKVALAGELVKIISERWHAQTATEDS